MTFVLEACLFLGAALLAVTLSRRFGFGAVLGYLAAGAALGPPGLGLVDDTERVLHFAELGVVLLLFVIGLELEPRRLWAMRGDVFGLGALQTVGTGVALSGAGLALGLPVATAGVVGFGLALSSTALVMQIFAERDELASLHGRKGFALLLFQDLAALPMLAVVPALAVAGAAHGEAAGGHHGGAELGAVAALAVVVAVVALGRLLLRPLLGFVASFESHELNTVSALFVVASTAAAMEAAGLSMALGAFLAGVLLAETEYRHELEADIEPFKGLLLGLFFMAVGMSLDAGVLLERPLAVLAGVVGLVAVKGAVLALVARVGGVRGPCAVNLALSLSQGGEFAFVIFGLAVSVGVIAPELHGLLIVVVTLSMVTTPIALRVLDRVRAVRASRERAPDYDVVHADGRPVIIAGYGRYGQIVSRVLRTKRIPFTALEKNPAHVEFVRTYGNEIFYGDAARLDLLRAAGAENARALVVAIDDPDESVSVVEAARAAFPDLAILARARNRRHALELRALGAHHIARETLGSSLETAQATLETLGLSYSDAHEAVRRFREHDAQLLDRQYAIRDDQAALVASTREAAEDLEKLFEGDVKR